MRVKRRVPDEIRQELLEQAIQKIRVALSSRNPAWEQCAAIVAEFISKTNVNASQLLSNASIHEIGLEVRYADLLYNLGYLTVRSLAGATESELRSIPGVGSTTIEHCRKVLRRLNMSFRGESPNLLRYPALSSSVEMDDD